MSDRPILIAYDGSPDAKAIARADDLLVAARRLWCRCSTRPRPSSPVRLEPPHIRRSAPRSTSSSAPNAKASVAEGAALARTAGMSPPPSPCVGTSARLARDPRPRRPGRRSRDRHRVARGRPANRRAAWQPATNQCELCGGNAPCHLRAEEQPTKIPRPSGSAESLDGVPVGHVVTRLSRR